MATNDKLAFFPVDIDSMSADLKKKWAALKKAQEAASAAREDFEAAFTAAAKKAERIEADISLAFGYRFGGLAIAKKDPATVKAKTSAKPKFTF